MRRARGGDGRFPWAWLMYHALDLGMTVAEFWDSTPRAICLLMAEMGRGQKQASANRKPGRHAGPAQVVKLDYIPRP